VPLGGLPSGREVAAANGVIWSSEDVGQQGFAVVLAQVGGGGCCCSLMFGLALSWVILASLGDFGILCTPAV
jgi:hypothetical protein